jgi:N-acetylneuraminate synthase
MALEKVYIIAEAGVNHNGSIDRAKEMIRVAADAGADAIKFQTFKAEELVCKTAPKAQYQLINTNYAETQYDMLKKLEIDNRAHADLIECCNTNNIEFLSTPFDSVSLNLLVNEYKLSKIKIPSGEITNGPFLLEIALTGKPVILSTGMSSLSEIEIALGILAFGYLNIKVKPSLDQFFGAYISTEGQKILQKKVTLLHCTTEYPAPIEDVNLRCIKTLHRIFDLKTGYSDHTEGIAIPLAAVACGATVIEKHFTLDRTLPGPDHKASLDPKSLKSMICGIRQIEVAMGDCIKMPRKSELENRLIARKSLVANDFIAKDSVFTVDNIVAKRPGDGLSPMHYWDKLGQKAECDYKKDMGIIK